MTIYESTLTLALGAVASGMESGSVADEMHVA